MGAILDEILEHKRREVADAAERVPLHELTERARRRDPPRSLQRRLEANGAPGARVIAEIKRASPSRGVMRGDLDPVDWAERYARAGAVALSVLTDARYFRGSLEDLIRIRERVDLPLLRKDFLIDPYQVHESRAAGADVVLLIVRALEDSRLEELLGAARALGMEALVEVHDEGELDRALRQDARLVGINNRDLKSFTVDLGVTGRLLPRVPAGVCVISASGIREKAQVRDLIARGVHAFLVGESLVTAADPEVKLRDLVS